jgi:four helix bundle protein
MRLYPFEKLEVWKLARTLTKNIYLASKEFPDDERFGLTSQIRRAAVSISSNIAEGSSRQSGKEQARYTEIAFGSLLEVLNQLITASDLLFISEETVNLQRPLIEEIGNKLNKLRESQIARTN